MSVRRAGPWRLPTLSPGLERILQQRERVCPQNGLLSAGQEAAGSSFGGTTHRRTKGSGAQFFAVKVRRLNLAMTCRPFP